MGQSGQPFLGLLAERLRFSWGVNAGQSNLVLFVFLVQQAGDDNIFASHTGFL